MIVERYFAVQKGWLPPEGSTAHVLVRLRNGAPVGRGTEIRRWPSDGLFDDRGPNWNNLANTPAMSRPCSN